MDNEEFEKCMKECRNDFLTGAEFEFTNDFEVKSKGETTIIIKEGVQSEVLRHDDKFIYFRLYEPQTYREFAVEKTKIVDFIIFT